MVLEGMCRRFMTGGDPFLGIIPFRREVSSSSTREAATEAEDSSAWSARRLH